MEKRLARVGAWSAALILLAPIVAAAAEGSAEPTTTEWIFRWLNFALVFGVGGWWAGKKLKVAFRRNAEKIATTIAEAEDTKRQAAERLQAAEAKLAAIEREAVDMRERARKDSAVEAERIRALAREESARAEHAAAAEIEAAERTVVNRLREMAIARTIERAREIVAERMTPAIDRRLFGRFVEALGRMGREA
jgi:F-type H+-transporting ATPase subunit b